MKRYPPDHIPYTGEPLSQGSREGEAPLSGIDLAPERESVETDVAGPFELWTIFYKIILRFGKTI